MISVYDALVLVGFGMLSALFLIGSGCVLHMRYLDRKLIKPVPKVKP